MIAYLYAYGKQKSLHYGTALIAKDLLPVRGELETLSAYQGHQQGERSFRHGYLDNGMEYCLCFAERRKHRPAWTSGSLYLSPPKKLQIFSDQYISVRFICVTAGEFYGLSQQRDL